MDLEIEYQENNYISFALGSVLEAFILGIPILALLTKEPGPKYFVSVGLILLTSFVVLCLIFIPKIRFLRRERAKQRERNMEQFVRNGPRANSDAGADFHDGSSFNGASSGDSLRIFGSDRGTDEASLPARPTIPGAASEEVTSETPDPGIRVKRHPKVCTLLLLHSFPVPVLRLLIASFPFFHPRRKSALPQSMRLVTTAGAPSVVSSLPLEAAIAVGAARAEIYKDSVTC